MRHLEPFRHIGSFVPKQDLVAAEKPKQILVVTDVLCNELPLRFTVDHFEGIVGVRTPLVVEGIKDRFFVVVDLILKELGRHY